MVDLKDLAHELALASAIEVGRWLDDSGAACYRHRPFPPQSAVCSTLD